MEQDSSTSIYHGSEKVIKLITTKFPGSKVLVSGLLPRWKINPREGMVFKKKTTEVKDKLSRLSGITFCEQDNFNRHMFYNGNISIIKGQHILLAIASTGWAKQWDPRKCWGHHVLWSSGECEFRATTA